MRESHQLREHWIKHFPLLPIMSFPSNWKVQIIPPYGGALIRFKLYPNIATIISVYLDVDDSLGSVGAPYWEIYDGHETHRYLLASETQEMNKKLTQLYREHSQ